MSKRLQSSPTVLLPGFTLIEMLVVIVIVSMVMGAAMERLSAVSESAARQATIAHLRQLDARSRLLAQSNGSGGVVLACDREGSHLRATAESPEDKLIFDAQIPPAQEVRLVQNDQHVDQVIIDRFGRSVDYAIELHDRASMQPTMRLHVCGLTGWTWEERP